MKKTLERINHEEEELRIDYSEIQKRYTNTTNFERLETMRSIESDFDAKREKTT